MTGMLYQTLDYSVRWAAWLRSLVTSININTHSALSSSIASHHNYATLLATIPL